MSYIIQAITTAFLNWLAALTRKQSDAVNASDADQKVNQTIEQDAENATTIDDAQKATNEAAAHAGRDPNS